jgi:hypothetical protein
VCATPASAFFTWQLFFHTISSQIQRKKLNHPLAFGARQQHTTTIGVWPIIALILIVALGSFFARCDGMFIIITAIYLYAIVNTIPTTHANAPMKLFATAK